MDAPISRKVVHVDSEDDEDPLDLLSTKQEYNPDRSTYNTRKLPPQRRILSSEGVARPRRRVRTASLYEEENLDKPTKKIKLTKGRKVTAITSSKGAIEPARNRFFLQYRSTIEALLPSGSKIFDKILADRETMENKVYHCRRDLLDQPQFIRGGQMKDYQLEGLSYLVWMHKNGMNAILGDEMGLGKTLQTLSLVAYLKEMGTVTEPHLIICPLSVVGNWMSESAHWAPSFNVVKFHGSQIERTRLKEELKATEFDILLTTYETYVAEDSWLKSRKWTYCVLDEGHKIKCSSTIIAQKLQGLGSQYRLILTGTPLQNNLLELWSLWHWLYPSLFTQATERGFREAFNLTLGKYNTAFLDAAQKFLAVTMLRRTKETVESKLPPLDEMVIFLPLTETQRFWYMRLLKRLDTLSLDEIFTHKSEGDDDGRLEAQAVVAKAMADTSSLKSKKYRQLMNLLMQLRRVCDHPYILEDSLPEPYHIGEHIVASSSKLQFLDKLLRELLPKGERVLIFSQWTGMLDMLEDFMYLRGIRYARLDGKVPRARRSLDIRLFQQEKSPYQVFLISTQAGGMGINLTKASNVVMCDSTWNPQVDIQAIARAHRIGQTKTVKVYRLICQNSVEDQMLDRLRKKLFLSIKLMTSNNEDAEMDPSLKLHELMQILYKGTGALARWESDSADKGLSAFLSASIEEIIARSRRQEDIRDFKLKRETGDPEEALDKQAEADFLEYERVLLSGIAQVQTRLFEGKHHEKGDGRLAQEGYDLQKRARVDRLVMVNGIESLPHNVAMISPSDKPKVSKRWRAKFEHEDWCLHCRDGGQLFCCNFCPRVFHAECVKLPRNARNSPIVHCPQHACADCGRKSADAGGMLFRCRCCVSAYCEDCVAPEGGEIAAIGPTIPELLLLGYGDTYQVYWIHCRDCVERFQSDSKWKRSWEKEDKALEAKLSKMKEEVMA